MINEGFKNEKKLINALSNQYFTALNPNLQRLIRQSFQKYEDIIICTAEAGHNKSDIKIQIGKETHTYSVKMGKGNSIHQEPIESFLAFLENEHHLNEKTKVYLQEFIWADGTLDGTGNIKARLNARTFKKQNPQKIQSIQKYFNTIKTSLLQRFLSHGVHASSWAEFIYYGNVKNGTLCKSEDAIAWLGKRKSRATLHLGKLNFQAWNRNLKGKKSAEKKRGVIQIKWGGLKRDIKKIAKINLGKQQEIHFVQSLNHKEDLNHWKILGLDAKKHYAIRITSPKYGQINQRKVWAKADAFIALGHVPLTYLKLNNYLLEEKDVKTFKLTAIKQSGISIKKSDSHRYSIAKLSTSTFKKLFSSNILGAAASIYYKKKKKLSYNKQILKAWGISQEYFLAYYAKKLNLPINSVSHVQCQKCLKKIKRYANKEIANSIKAHKNISDFIFLGKGNFQEPFTAPWIFEHGTLKRNQLIPFKVSTGSGRSKGKCTIIIKPK